MKNRLIVLSLLATLLATLPACYRYVPEPTLAPVPGMEYRAFLTAAGTEEMRPLLGQNVLLFGGRAIALTGAPGPDGLTRARASRCSSATNC